MMLPVLLAALLQTVAAPAPNNPGTSAGRQVSPADGPPPLTPALIPAPRAHDWPTREADYIVPDFRFRTGETLEKVRLHYTTLGSPHRGANGEIDNAVMIVHGTGGTGGQFLSGTWANELYGPGQPLDIAKYWIILPDVIGHGKSSKPSDGLHMRFPQYDYDDMVELQHRLLVDGLGIRHVRLIMGTSMGCMHGFVWAETYPDYARAIMPLACMPVELAGQNRMWRQLLIDAVKNDPAWMGGEYKIQPVLGIRTASSLSIVVGGTPLNAQALNPTREQATATVRRAVERDIASRDANDMIYQFESSRNYNPWPGLGKIKVPMTWINSADDFINPRNFPYPQEAVARVPSLRFRQIQESTNTHGHGTHTWARFWKQDLIDLLKRSEK